jgi:hypothetical protein
MDKDTLKVRGMFRINIVDPDGTIVGDSGWVENQVTNLGFKLYLADNIGASAGSKQIGYVGLGTGTAPGAAHTYLQGEIADSDGSITRKGVTYSNVASTTAQFVATFASGDNHISAAQNISNIGLFALSTTDTVFAGTTYASSSCDTNQNVNVTYQIQFS